MTYELTKEEAVKRHREMWHWLAETGLGKYDYIKQVGAELYGMYNRGDDDIFPRALCWLCEYAEQNYSDDRPSFCGEYCILKWGSQGGCGYYTSDYRDWAGEEYHPVTKKAAAKRIAELPLNKRQPE